MKKTFISIVVPCYNEEAILQANLSKIIYYLKTKSDKYQWEIVIVNDGSADSTGNIAELFANEEHNVRFIHHPVNLNLRLALQTGFRHSKGDIIAVLDVDLLYAVDYIEQMVHRLLQPSAAQGWAQS